MKKIVIAAAMLGIGVFGSNAPAQAAGCLSGAAVGGVAGHVVGHHAVLGAAAGCAIGHHEAAKHERERRELARSNDPRDRAYEGGPDRY